jgi:hypothetical protein
MGTKGFMGGSFWKKRVFEGGSWFSIGGKGFWWKKMFFE